MCHPVVFDAFHHFRYNTPWKKMLVPGTPGSGDKGVVVLSFVPEEVKSETHGWRHGVAFSQGRLSPRQLAFRSAPRDAKCIWVTRAGNSGNLSGSGTDLLPGCSRKEVEIVPAEQLYGGQGLGWRQRLLSFWRTRWEEAKAEGCSHLYILGEVALPAPVPFPEVLLYEQEADLLLRELNSYALCIYNIFEVDRGQILDLIATHDYFSLEVAPGRVLGPISRHHLPSSGAMVELIDLAVQHAYLHSKNEALAKGHLRLTALKDMLAEIIGELSEQLTVLSGFAELEHLRGLDGKSNSAAPSLFAAAKETTAVLKHLVAWKNQFTRFLAEQE